MNDRRSVRDTKALMNIRTVSVICHIRYSVGGSQEAFLSIQDNVKKRRFYYILSKIYATTHVAQIIRPIVLPQFNPVTLCDICEAKIGVILVYDGYDISRHDAMMYIYLLGSC